MRTMMTMKMRMTVTVIPWMTELDFLVMKRNILVCNRISCFVFRAVASRSIYGSDLDVDGSSSTLSIVCMWRAQRLVDEERIALEERVFNAEEHLKARLAADGVTSQGAESLTRRIKNARAKHWL
jgi:hypothetical protein